MKASRMLLVGSALLLAGIQTLTADTLVTRSASHTGKITRVEKETVFIRTGAAEIGIARKDVVRVEVPETEELKQGRAAAKDGKPEEAIKLLQPLLEPLVGLPVPWILENLLLLSDMAIQTKDFGLARKTLDRLQDEYPKQLTTGEVDVRLARMQCEQKQCGPATTIAKQLIAELLKKDYLNPVEQQTIAEGYLVLGDCQVAGGNTAEALESYLRVVALFDLDAARAAQAQFKAARLFEGDKKWKRAQAGYREALERTPSASWAAEAKQRLAAIEQAHPE